MFANSKKVTTFAPAIEREILDKKDGPFVYRLGRKIFILERGFDSPTGYQIKKPSINRWLFYLVALLCAGYPAAQFENGSVLKFGPLTQN